MNTQNIPDTQDQNESANSASNRDFDYFKEKSKKIAKKKIYWNENNDKIENIDFYNDLDNKVYKIENFINDLKDNLSWNRLTKLSSLPDDEKEDLFEVFIEEINRITRVLNYFKDVSEKFARKKLSWSDLSIIKDISFYNNFNEYNQIKFLKDFKDSLSWDDSKTASIFTKSEQNHLFESFTREINKIWVIFERKREQAINIIEKRFVLNGAWKTRVEKAIKELDSENLDKLIFSYEDLDVFIEQNIQIVEKKDPDEAKNAKILFEQSSFKSSSEFQNIIEEKIRQNPDLWSKDEVMTSLTLILNKIKSWEKIRPLDINGLFSYGVFNDEQKKWFLKLFLPIISLQELVDLRIIDVEHANNTKKEELVSYLKKKRNLTSIDDNDPELITILSDLSLKDVTIYTNTFIESDLSKLENSEVFAQKVTESFNKTTEEIKEKILSKVQTVDVFRKKLMEGKIRGKIKNSEEVIKKLQAWSILKIKTKQSDWEFDNFIEIISFWDDWKFIWKDRSFYGWGSELDWRYNSSSSIASKDMYYTSLLDLLETDNIKNLDVLSPEDLKENIDSGKIVETSDTLWEPWKAELTKYQEYIDEKIRKVSEWKTQEELEKDEEYKRLKEIKEKIISEWADVRDLDIKDDLNLFMLESKIDEFDFEWKEYWFKEWVSFKVTWWENEEFQIYTINNINKISKTIQIHSAFWEVEVWSYEQFFQIFKGWNIERISNNTSFSSLHERIGKDSKLGSTWWDFKIVDNKLVSKNENNKATYNYLVQDKNSSWNADNVVKIWEVSWVWWDQMVKVSFWKIKKQKTGKKNKEGKDVEQEYYEFNTEDYVTVACLENYIKKYSLKPETNEKDKEEKVNTVKQWEKPQWWFFKWYLSNKSVSEIIGWLQMWFKEFKEHLKSGNEEHQAKIALATWWKFMPMEVRLELKSRVEKAEKTHMDEAVARLKAVDTPDAISLIYRRLSYSNTEEYKKEAALIFMLEKYWNIYNKNYTHSPLNSKKWEFLWFKALSWNRWDVTKHPLYIEVKKECDTPDIDGKTRNFTEEELVWKLMKKQCWDHWYYWIHRRSRLHKEVEKLKKAWLKAEVQDWYDKANDTRNPKDQLSKWLGELAVGSPANCIWRFKKLVDRWDDMATMSTIPLVLIFSWVSTTLPDDLCDIVKGMVDEWRCIPLARFMTYPKDMTLAMKTIRILSKKIQQKRPDLYPNIWDEAEEIYQDFTTKRISERDRVDKVMKFFQNKRWTNWKTYAQVLTRVISMSADWQYWDDSELNSLFLTEKDKPWEDWAILNKYLANQNAYMWVIQMKKEYFWDSFEWKWLSSMWYQVAREVLKQHSSGWFSMSDSNAWPAMVAEIKKEILATQRRSYSNEEDRKTWLKYYLKNIFAWLIESSQSKTEAVNKLFMWVGPLKFFSDNWWITFQEFINKAINQNDIMSNTEKSEALFDKFVHNIINDTKWDEIDATMAETLGKTSHILNGENN